MANWRAVLKTSPKWNEDNMLGEEQNVWQAVLASRRFREMRNRGRVMFAEEIAENILEFNNIKLADKNSVHPI